VELVGDEEHWSVVVLTDPLVCVEGDDGVSNNGVLVRRWGLEEELVGKGEEEPGVVEPVEGGGDKGVTEEGAGGRRRR